MGGKRYEVIFEDAGKTVSLTAGETLLQATEKAGIPLDANCGGEGVCGRCKLQILEGDVDTEDSIYISPPEKKRGIVLACKTRAKSTLRVRIPEEAVRRKLNIVKRGERLGTNLIPDGLPLASMVREVPIELTPPTLEDYTSDLDRLLLGLKLAGEDPSSFHMNLKCLQEFETALHEGGWKVKVGILDQGSCAGQILYVHPANREFTPCGLAIDVGTTSVVAYLVRLSDGRILGSASDLNAQVACGADVITRIIYAAKGDGLERLQRHVLSTINGLVDVLAAETGITPHEIVTASVGGNTTMIHLLLKIDPSDIRREPYIPTGTTFPILLAGEIGID